MPDVTRRTFLWLAGGSGIALAANPQRKLVNKLIPLVVPPEQTTSGEWSTFATTCRECPAGCGLHLWHRDGRVTKAEGNPLHPINNGRLCPRGQSSLQGQYDPDRLKRVTQRMRGQRKQERSWEDAFTGIGKELAAGRRVTLLSNLQTGTLAEVMGRFVSGFGGKLPFWYEPFGYEHLKKAHGALFGLPVVPDFRIEQCRFVLSFGADFLETWISPVSFARQFVKLRTLQEDGTLGRMAYVGPRLSMTAANADTFFLVPPGYERVVAAAVLKTIIEQGWASRDVSPFLTGLDRIAGNAAQIPGVDQESIEQLARSFSQARSSVALAGPVGSASPQAVETALLCALLNFACGRVGDTVDFSRHHALTGAGTEEELEKLLASLGSNDIVFVHQVNPAYSRTEGANLLQRAGLVVYLGTMPDETAEVADWVLPVDSPLEAWGDYEPSAGVMSLLQPTMARITDSRNAGDIFLELSRRGGRPLSRSGVPAGAGFEGWLAARWGEVYRTAAVGVPEDQFWKEALRTGGYWRRTGSAPVPVTVRPAAANLLTGPPPAPGPGDRIELWVWGSVLLHDGRTANRGWIQETPDPVSFIAWGNWIDIHPGKAKELNIGDGDLAELSSVNGTIQAPVRVTTEVAENTVAISFGQGHHAMGRNARRIGANAFSLLGRVEEGRIFPSCRIRRVGGSAPNGLTYTAPTRSQHGRHLVQWVPLSVLRMKKEGEGEELRMPLPEGYRPETDLYPQRQYLRHRWAMVIDLHRCIGCAACAVACYAENNVPVMGKKQVGRQLEMAWLRVPPYRKDGGGSTRYGWIPMLCQHCDQAPCEPVCPVYAAVHNEEGLNAQIYNRCIGTRYCSNNCPYKVRRFNWLTTTWEPPLDLQLNPEVTVRSRGVMEKCTFCVQRIRLAEYRAFRENREIRDGEITPACAQTCPMDVFTFGDLLDPQSGVNRLVRGDPRRYQVLKELNTKPAVIYLQRIENDIEA